MMHPEKRLLSDPKSFESARRRMAQKTRRNPKNGCLEWTPKSRANGGYGTLCVGRNGHVRAHRAAWMLANGEIPAGLYVCHKCDNPLCCDPAHLFLGTPAQNMADKKSKGRGTIPPVHFGEKHHNTKFGPKEVLEIRASTDPQWKIAERHGVSEMTVWRIRKRITWQHVP